MNQHWLKPNWEPGTSITDIPLQHLFDEGIKAIILDVDKTLLYGRDVVLHYSVLSWVMNAKKHLKLHLLSNNPSKERIESVSNQLEVPFTYKAAKPRRSSLQRVIKGMQIYPTKIAMVGDRIFTDILAGNRLGLYTILVKPIGPDGSSCPNAKIQLLEQKLARYLGAEQ